MPLQKAKTTAFTKKSAEKSALLDELTAQVGRNPVCILQTK
ncbi:hypothetical protein SC499_04040 [Peribacillus simplex]|nr:hypothetical protein [Peribacillus simplex]MDW7613905.1 hypothetical protein [Peribacillus simplex]